MFVNERNFVEFMISTCVEAYYNMQESEVRELVGTVKAYGKGDTLGLDAKPEIIFRNKIYEFDRDAIFVTEENALEIKKALPSSWNPSLQPTMFISDPVDRSSQLKKFLHFQLLKLLKQELKKEDECSTNGFTGDDDLINDSDITVRDIIKQANLKKDWDEKFGGPTDITGSTINLSCVHHGRVVGSVCVNIITGKAFVACGLGVFCFAVDEKMILNRVNLEVLFGRSSKIFFPSFDWEKKNKGTKDSVNPHKVFVTYSGKSGYPEHFQNTGILVGSSSPDKYLHYDLPGGPTRIHYLSQIQDKQSPIGFICSNGEKITEWIHWLPNVKYGRKTQDHSKGSALKVFEAYTPSVMLKNGIPMSVSPSLSLFQEKYNFGRFLNINKIGDYDNPSHYRSMLVICRSDNLWLIQRMEMNGFREVSEYI